MSELARISLPTWREDAIARVVGMYDAEDADGEPIVKVKRTATDIERFGALIELLDELYPEASMLVRSSKASPKTRLTVVLGRLDEISLEGRRFAEIKPGQYDWTDADDLEKTLRESVRQAKAKPTGENKQAPRVDDEYVRQVVKQTAPKPTAKARQAKPRTTTAAAKPKPITRKRTTAK
jgi:hypothetical protein